VKNDKIKSEQEGTTCVQQTERLIAKKKKKRQNLLSAKTCIAIREHKSDPTHLFLFAKERRKEAWAVKIKLGEMRIRLEKSFRRFSGENFFRRPPCTGEADGEPS